MKDVILIANAGSSSLKISIFAIQNKRVNDKIYNIFLEKNNNKILFYINQQKESTTSIKDDPIEMMINLFEEWWKKQSALNLIATGHRIVHGGKNFNKPVVVNKKVIKELRVLIPLSPLHQPYNLQVLDLFFQKYKAISHIICFDTSFHCTNSPITKAFGLPKQYYDKGIMRYGFHGLSYQYVSSHFKEITMEDLPPKAIIAHLGSGSSLCAIKNGLSLTSSMGFSVLDGVMMATRPGNLDPGVVLYLINNEKMTINEITELLYKKSGLLGMSGESSDMRTLIASNSHDSKFAVDLFVYRIVLEIGKLIAALEGIDCLIFTAGVGQNSPVIREMISKKLSWLGIKIDYEKNQKNEHRISTKGSKIKVFVVPTNEELIIAEEVMKFL
ncbi:acetate/propionate family kinase [Rickettsia prowazekii]|uniref:Acetate kinase n=2 Tax=Rickettsia prowazekii TaxID=782 RepID=ACKA_RICPR|nr:acetate/propionate family kinase [Rickettsia prowazekii]Q9ZE38.1 RecName: Full=Acetate kinase; AltName: Full=Acetokinase [Rickettsia prowazekii str. Madrid E]EOB09999.1 Acetate kinase [Rickettsia prowazekii str. GvF12]ADE29618.1 Acetate kinase [Rickettsia prowazekii str. Rp22]AFE48934.1 acetate kinase [Rickettsia prowazekii str. Chernikova]AFE49779.1 acetate kinase [Rickettsia prowazekii str. Katsinyian]AFE50623.1 acetate kinase [Rickettsia prowazekii str. BuV67-CWPP]